MSARSTLIVVSACLPLTAGCAFFTGFDDLGPEPDDGASDVGDASADSTGDGVVDGGGDTGHDVGSDTADSTSPDGDADASPDGDAGCTGVCSPGTSEPVTGTCSGFFETKQHTCAKTCTWGPDECKVPSGWHPMAAAPSGFAGRMLGATAWTGSSFIVWGGAQTDTTGSISAYLADGALYDPAKNAWTLMAAPPTGFVGRYAAAVGWSGTKLVIWGGDGSAGTLKDGAAYDPKTDSWTTLPASPLTQAFPNGAFADTSGSLLVWGTSGLDVTSAAGAAYSPLLNSWTAMPSSPLSARSSPSFAWTGTQLMIWGGFNASAVLGDGARFNPVSGTWTMLDDPPLGFTARLFSATATAAGSMIIWGGQSSADASFLADGAMFDAKGGSQTVPAIPDSVMTPSGRDRVQSWSDGTDTCWFWSGGQLDFIKGKTFALASGGASYRLSTKTWSAMASAGEPSARFGGQTAWAGSFGIVWGGATATSSLSDGAIYAP